MATSFNTFDQRFQNSDQTPPNNFNQSTYNNNQTIGQSQSYFGTSAAIPNFQSQNFYDHSGPQYQENLILRKEVKNC